jgi:exonuclease SbcD
MERHLIPLINSECVPEAFVLAVPFLRQADLPGLQLGAEGEAEPAVTAAARALHLAMTEAAVTRAGGLPILAMGHLTCAGGLESEGAERRILIGGEHAVPPDIFPPTLSYVALGHLHRPQSLDGGRVRYSGSPFPLSAAEIAYDHGVTLLDLDHSFAPRHIPLPRPVPMYRFPAKGAAPIAEVAASLAALDHSAETAKSAQPFVYLSVLADHPAPQLAAEVEALIEALPVRFAGLSITRPDAVGVAAGPPPSLADTVPEDLFRTAYVQAHELEPNPAHLAAFRDALSEV